LSYFTFGLSHTHPVTGDSLSGCYVISDRETVLKHFGRYWAFEYPHADGPHGAGVEKYNLREIQLPAVELFDAQGRRKDVGI
jgi:hypothetical protein